MDIVFIQGLKVETVIGIYDWEREIRQVVIVDLEMGTDIRQAASTEDIESTLNYKSVSDRLIDFIRQSQFLLVETMAEEIAALVMAEFSVPWVKVTVGKPDAILEAKSVGVTIERGSRF